MIIKSCFSLVEIANEYMLIPIEDVAKTFNGIIALNDAAGYLLQHMKKHKTKDELVDILMSDYAVDRTTAEADVDDFLQKLSTYGVFEE